MNQPSDAATLFDQRIWRLINIDDQTTAGPRLIVSVGGQPGAGKERAAAVVAGQYPDQQLLRIDGDKLRPYAPTYKRAMATDPRSMPQQTSSYSGAWVGMAINRALREQKSLHVEGTWNDPAMVLDTLHRAKQDGYRTHAAVLAVPAIVSRAGLLTRYYDAQDAGLQPRWSSPKYHDLVVKQLPQSIEQIAGNDNVDTFMILDRAGNILLRAEPSRRRAAAALATYRQHTERDLTPDEHAFLSAATARLAPHFQDPTRHPSEEQHAWDDLLQAVQSYQQPIATPPTHAPAIDWAGRPMDPTSVASEKAGHPYQITRTTPAARTHARAVQSGICSKAPQLT